LIRRLLELGLLVAALGATSLAGEIACLRNGFTIHHDRHEIIGDKTRLYIGNGYIDLATSEIVQFEPDDGSTLEPTVAKSSPTAKSIERHLLEASQSSGIDRDFLESVIHHESGFNPKAVSPKGARGLMQLMPETANQLGVKDSFDPGQNIQGGTAYLRQLLDLYHGDAQKALAAYNAGPHRVQQYQGVPPYRETRAYVARIIREYNQKKRAEQRAAARANTTPKRAQQAADSKSPKSVQTSSSPKRAAHPGS
jgi:membrane-bound lytic murein transglycosylase MltF